MFMVDLLLDALKELDTMKEPSDRKDMLAQLQRDEDADYDRFFSSSVPDLDFVKGLWNENIDEDHAVLFRSPAMCHTALLPAESRYKGILNNEMNNSSFENFDVGIERAEAGKRSDANTSAMQLVHKNTKQCPSQVAIDSKDYFFVTYRSGEASLTVPNKAEKDIYVVDGHEFHGLILVCFFRRHWERYPAGYLGPEAVNNGDVTMWVNGNRVTEMSDVDDCSLLRGDNGYVWNANDQGEYVLTAQLNETYGFMQITSVILL